VSRATFLGIRRGAILDVDSNRYSDEIGIVICLV